MKKKCKERQSVHRPVPCPSYDIAGTERWLSELAEEGLFLSKDGFFADIARFDVKAPRKAKYRLEAIQHKGDDVPDTEQIELGEMYSWEFVAKRGDFFIFRSYDPSARELNTDPGVQAIALNVVKKKRREAFASALFFLLVYPFLLTKGCMLLTTIAISTPLVIAAFILGAWAVVEQAKAYFHLIKIQKDLSVDGYYDTGDARKKSRIPYQVKRTVSLIATIMLVIAFLKTLLNISALPAISIKDYEQALPFATIEDFAGENSKGYRYTMEGFLTGSIDVIQEKTDWIAPVYLEYNEHAQVTKADGNLIDGGLYVDYIEMRSPRLAKIAAKELYRYDKLRYFSTVEKLAPLELDADGVICYENVLHAPTVILQKGNIVVRAYFYQTSPEYQIPFAEWAETVCESIQE